MKKLLIAVGFVFAAGAAQAQVTDPETRKELKQVFYDECITNTEIKSDDPTYKYMKKFCECSADKVMDKFTEKELGDMNGWSEEQVTNILQPVIKNCMDKLEKELTEFYEKK